MIKNSEIKYKRLIPGQKELLNLFNNLPDIILTDKTLMPSKEENKKLKEEKENEKLKENENETENENEEDYKNEYENDENKYENENNDETMDLNKKIQNNKRRK